MMVERVYEGNDENYLLEHKHCKIWKFPSHTSKIMATNNFKTLIPWSCWIQNGLQPKHGVELGELEVAYGHKKHTKDRHNKIDHLAIQI
jgi:hypothetical protein